MTSSEFTSPILCDGNCLTLDEAAAAGRWGSLSSIHLYRRQGRLPAHKMLNRVHLRPEDLDALLRPAPINQGLDPEIAAWARSVAKTAPRLTEGDAARVAALLVRAGGAAA